MDDCLGRQFARLKKVHVKTATYLETHSELLALVLPAAPLHAVVAAKGDWAAVHEEVQALLGAGPLGKALFTFAGLAANAASFALFVDSKLKDLVDEGFAPDKVVAFKAAVAEKVQEFKALLLTKKNIYRYVYQHISIHNIS
jgi:hypothetical protein